MSFFRKKSGLEIPPVAGDGSNDAARNELFGARGGGRSVSPQPPPYRPPTGSSVYNASRDGDLSQAPPDRYNNNNGYRDEKRQDSGGPSGRSGPGPVPERYGNRSAIGDPYARGGNADADRAALFSGFDPSKRPAGGAGGNRFADGPAGRAGGNDDGPREFQTQEDEDEEVEGIKQQTRWVKQESVQSTRNALRIAREAEETGRNTLLRLGDQSEKLANTERYVDQGKLHAARAEDKTDELKKLNRSIFRPAITFNKDAKRAAQEAKVAARYDEERMNRERAMGDVRDSQNRLGRAAGYQGQTASNDYEDDGERIGGSRGGGRSAGSQRQRQDARKRYQFEATASDDELEDELDDNLDEISRATKGLKAIALAAGEELDRQNERIDNISNKTSKLNMRVDVTTNRLKRI